MEAEKENPAMKAKAAEVLGMVPFAVELIMENFEHLDVMRLRLSARIWGIRASLHPSPHEDLDSTEA